MHSDIDFIVIATDLPRGRINRVVEFEAIERAVESSITSVKPDDSLPVLSPVFKTPSEVTQGSLLFLDMVDDVRLLYDRNDYFRNILATLRRQLDARDARRIPYKGGWYWDLKPGYSMGETVDS